MNARPRVQPDYSAYPAATTKSFWRGVTAHALGTIKTEDPETIIERAWKGDNAAKIIARGVAQLPAATTGMGFHDILPIGTGVTLAPAAAAARLYQNAVQLDFTGVNQILVPKLVTPPTAAWVAEGSSASMVQPVLGSVVVGPLKKILFGAACTGELESYTPQTASRVIEATLSEAAALAIDSALLDNAAADAVRPAGLLNGWSTLGATAGGGLAALVSDLGKIAGAMSTAKISAEGLMLFCNDADAIRARGLLSPAFALTYTIVGTPAITAGTIVGIAPGAIAMAFGPPQIEVSTQGVVHMATDAHDNIDTQAVAETVKTSWQSNLLAFKVRLRTIWAPLATGAVQFISSLTW